MTPKFQPIIKLVLKCPGKFNALVVVHSCHNHRSLFSTCVRINVVYRNSRVDSWKQLIGNFWTKNWAPLGKILVGEL